jgi:hypothetical protein
MIPRQVRTEFHVDLKAFSQPLASKRFHTASEALDWSLNAVTKLRLAFDPHFFKQLSSSIHISISATFVAKNYTRTITAWEGSLGLTETAADAAIKRFAEKIFPEELDVAKLAADVAEKRKIGKTVVFTLSGALLFALAFAGLRLLPPVFDPDIQSSLTQSSPPEIIAGAWAATIEACETNKIVFLRGRVEIFSINGVNSHPARYERIDSQNFQVILSNFNRKVIQHLQLSQSGAVLTIQRGDSDENAGRENPRAVQTSRLIRCR